MQSFRSFSIGMQVVNGYIVNIDRVVSAQQTGVKSAKTTTRKIAKSKKSTTGRRFGYNGCR